MSEIDTHTPGPTATITRRTTLAWRTDADREAAGTPFPRAASGLARHGAELVMVQDDAASLALVDPATGLATAVALPNPEGRRFDPGHAPKRLKPDLESCVVVTLDGHPRVLAFGSGSTERRARVAIFDPDRVALVAVPELYAALRTHIGGGALNIEGATLVGQALWFFQRGNGGAYPAVAHVDLGALWSHLHGGPVPAIEGARRVELGAIDGVDLGFTDADAAGAIWWLGSAEASPNTYDDGAVVGSAVGLLDGAYAILREADGACFRGKAEGLVIDGSHAWVAVDPDDPNQPAELLEVALEGFTTSAS